MVYISSMSLTLGNRQTVTQIQNELNNTQKEIASGVSSDVGLAIGGRASQYVDLSQHKAALTALTADNAITSTRLSTTSTALDSIRTAAQSFLTALTTASSSGGLTTSLQSNASSSLTALTSALNTFVGGQYIFAGINTDVKPVTDYTQSPASANKTAVDTAFSTAFGFAQSSASANTISGTAMQSFLNGSFGSMFTPSGFGTSWSSASNQLISSGIAPGQTADTSVSANGSPFRQLAQAYTMVTEFGGTNFGSDASGAVISSAVGLVTSALSGLITTQAGVGIVQNAVTTADTAMKAESDVLTSQTGDLVEVDTYDLTTRLSNLQTQLQASFEMTAKLQNMSLVNYLS